MALWVAAFLISMTWLYSIHLYLYARPFAVVVLTVAGLVTFALALRKRVDLSKASMLWGVLIAPLLIGFLIAGFPFNFGPGLLILGLAGLLLCRVYRLSAVAAALLLAGAILTLQSLVYPLYFNYVAAKPYVPFLAGPVYALTRYLGIRTSLSDGVVYVQTMRNLWPFPTDWAKLALFPLLQLFIAAAIIMPLFGSGLKKGIGALWIFIIGMAYIIIRYALMLVLFTYLMYYVDYYDTAVWIDIFWSRSVTLLTFIPLLLILAKCFPLKRDGAALAAGFDLQPVSGRVLWRKLAAVCAVALGVHLLVAHLGYWDGGKPRTDAGGKTRESRILIDETHSNWEKTDRPYDTNWYGNESGYNYWSISELLGHYYKVDKNESITTAIRHYLKGLAFPASTQTMVACARRNKAPADVLRMLERMPDHKCSNWEDLAAAGRLTPELLANYDVVLLKNPTYPYSPAELDALVEFVRNGGGIFLMGEHTNVFGTSVPLNTLGRRFGFYFTYTSVFDMEQKFEQLWHVPELMPSPLVQNQRNFLYATSCSVERTGYFGPARNAAVGGGLWSLPIEYASGNFYPAVQLRTDMTFGPMIQLITSTHGKGRVIGFTDSTTFSNFSAQLPGKPELLLSSMTWLNRRNHLNWLNTFFLVASLLCFAGAIVACVGTPRHHGTRIAMLAVGVCVAAATMVMLTAITRRAYPLLQPQRPFTKVVFEKEFSEYEIPVSGFVKDQQKSFSIFYQWVLRLQYYPFLKYTLDEAIAENPDVLVMINPKNITPPGRDFVDHADNDRVLNVLVPKLHAFLNSGGKLLLMDDITNDRSFAHFIVEPLGMWLEGNRAAAPAMPGQQQSPPMQAMDADNRMICTVPTVMDPMYKTPTLLSINGDEMTPLIRTSNGKVVLASKKVGKGTLLVMSSSKRFCDTMMGYSQNNAPSADALSAFRLQYAMLRGLANNNIEEEIAKLATEAAKPVGR